MNREFIEYLSERKNETLAVATILYTCGSTPRKAGTSMVVFPDGSIFGTIGGGRAENEIRLSAVDSLNKKEVVLVGQLFLVHKKYLSRSLKKHIRQERGGVIR